MNLFYDLPMELQGFIYEFDNTRRDNYRLVLRELNFVLEQIFYLRKLFNIERYSFKNLRKINNHLKYYKNKPNFINPYGYIYE